MDPEPDLSTWQKIVQRRTFTQNLITSLLQQKNLSDHLYPILRKLTTKERDDGFAREAMDALVQEQLALYKQRIPNKIWGLLSEDRTVPWQEALDITQELVIDLAQDKSWKVEIQPNKRVFSVKRDNKVIFVPRKNMHSQKFVAVLFHELVVHVLRFVQRQIVLEGYRLFEEGLASSLQMYIMQEPIIKYGRNKVRDFLLLLWELGVPTKVVEDTFKAMQNQGLIPGRPYSWQKKFFHILSTHHGVFELKKRYKIYSIGTYRFAKFLRRYNSTDHRTAAIARIISPMLLQAKFDPMNKEHLRKMIALNLLNLSKEDIDYFVTPR